MNDISSHIQQFLSFKGCFAWTTITELSTEDLEQLSGYEREELKEQTNVRRQREFVTSRLLLKKMAHQSLPVQDDIQIRKDELGQPFAVCGDEQYFVSIAHTRQHVFCGITVSKPIGIDLEPVERKVPSKLSKRISHPNESQAINEIPTVQLWTIKEAYIKLRGEGLRMNMNEVCIQPSGAHFEAQLNNDKRAKICSFQSENNWVAVAHYQ
ncbi:Phosphopantetheinyl transferase [Fodinibius salinus]|uniref:Phosphopantetheinyl transferase n=1 Tax=Fodinibius salinus TaxID=860790 RepID=A0A5D3YMN6_9BACT|nr:4'-phosphopantetheinyl transferase superfamily protein [Fodinibius salinus]TYP95376.1 Phosphopantetheinyl transferase [Fodinibius salinus]